jgi:endonuclease/exonuclease/phosphatase family metal-dependent hydrolase
MPLSDEPTTTALADRDRLRSALGESPDHGGVPERRADRLLVATWNVRALGSFTDKWDAAAGDSPKRDLRALLCIAEILTRFDVTAIQELRSDTTALRALLEHMNRDDPGRWRAVLTDVTRGDPGNDERLGIIYDSEKVELSGLAAELVLPVTDLIEADAASVQFARTPYAVSFRSGLEHFTLVTLHVLWGTLAGRTAELAAIAEWLAEWAVDPDIWASDVIALGDFNIDRHDSPRWQAFVSTGLWLPWELFDAPRTIFGRPGPDSGKFYDQIAWFGGDTPAPDAGGAALSMSYRHSGGSFDFVTHVMQELSRQELSHRMSDHYPLWVEFDRRT